MSSPIPLRSGNARIARRAREQFVTHLHACLTPLGQAAHAQLMELAGAVASPREMQDRRDALLEFKKKGPAWVQATAKAWHKAIDPPHATAQVRMESLSLELIGDEVVEQKIIASRLALGIQEKATWELNDLKVRMQHLDGEEQASSDIMRPEALCQMMVEQWGAVGLGKTTWSLIQDLVQRTLREHVPPGYAKTNEFLIQQGVMRDIDLSARVRRTAGSRQDRTGPSSELPEETQPAALNSGAHGLQHGHSGPQGAQQGPHGGHVGYGAQGTGVPGAHGTHAMQGSVGPNASQGPSSASGGFFGRPAPGGPAQFGTPGAMPGRGAFAASDSAAAFSPTTVQPLPGDMPSPGSPVPPAGAMQGRRRHAMPGGIGGARQPGAPAGLDAQASDGRQHAGAHARAADSRPANVAGVSDETRMMTSTPPLARARQRASGVLGQLKRLLTDRVAGFESAPPTRPSTDLQDAIAQQATQVQATVVPGGMSTGYDNAAVQQVAVDLRRRTGELKKKAATSNEKATIEIVALMFQSILAEERIPPAIRVWFARLQMPVLRVALSEPEFFGTLEHPARQLIDRMGSVVLGFDTASIGGSALETEIKRIVQVIEQYPETGRRVFQLVYEEFQKFLSRYLTEKGPTQKLVSVAQQVEQKETLAIQYTIELRSLLADIPVRDEIREFLFKVWAEVLAVAAVRHGPQHAETLSLKSAASELVWAASAKPNRAERARVIQDLPKLLHRLRQGMSLVGVVGNAQETHIKVIGETLADAFLSKTEAIPQARIDEMAERLAHLEDYVDDSPDADVPLDAESIEMMLGIDASDIVVIADGGSKPNAAMLAWAAELQVGTWFTLDHNGGLAQVQYVWCSDRKQLHLFAAAGGRSYLVQASRLAAYLQAGLLLPAEEEALTVRATRDALAKLDANPERLLQ